MKIKPVYIFSILFFAVLAAGFFTYFQAGALNTTASATLCVIFTILAAAAIHGRPSEEVMGMEFVEYDRIRQERAARRERIRRMISTVNAMSSNVKLLQRSIYSRMYVILD